MAELTVDGLGELTSPAANDEIGIWDVSAGQYLKIRRDTLVGGTITGGGTVATGGFTLTVPATGTLALLGTANVFTAAQQVVGASVGARVAASGTGAGVVHVAPLRSNSVALLNGQAFTITFDGDSALLSVTAGYGALLFATYVSATVVELADPDTVIPAFFEVTKGANSRVVTIKNVSGSSRNVAVLAVGAITAVTDPA